MEERALREYLNDHLAGSLFGERTARHVLDRGGEPALREFLQRFLVELGEDRAVLRQVMSALRAPMNPTKWVGAWATELAKRLKVNRLGFRYTPASRFVDLEALRLGVEGKLSLWRTLDALSGRDARLAPFDFKALAARTEQQSAALERSRLAAALEAFQPATASPAASRRQAEA